MKCAVTIGNFDGIHRGHRALIDSLFQWKKAHPEIKKTVVVTFDPHPSEVLLDKTVCRLTLLNEKIEGGSVGSTLLLSRPS